MAKQLWKHGTGNYPNNVINYLLNVSPMYYVYIPEDSRELRMLWEGVSKKLPPFVKATIEMVFDEQFTLKQTARRIGASATTTRRIVRRLHSWLNKDGFAMQPLYNYAVSKGYVYSITMDDIKEAWAKFFDPKDISEADAVQFMMYLERGLLISDCAKLIGVRLAVLTRLYYKAIEINKKKQEDKR